MKFERPEYNKNGFNCPHCQAFAHQEWFQPFRYVNEGGGGPYMDIIYLRLSHCLRCKEYALWINGVMIYPEPTLVPPANEDLNNEIKDDYNEASGIVNKSPRGAAALLRLAIEKLCRNQLNENGKDLDEIIGKLVKKGLPIGIQQSLDVVRVIGNEAVHPGKLDLRDDKETATKLFELVNIIANVMITQPKEIEKLYDTLPKAKLDGIKQRDADKQ